MSGVLLGGRYELRSPLGSGGFGTVWQAVDTNLGRLVAVKVLRIDAALPPADRAAAVERFRREARALATLNHANVVTAHDFAVDGDQAYLVMELIDGVSIGEDLHRRLSAGERPYGTAEALRIAAGICAGLAAAHDAGLVHRDLKPANVMLAGPRRQVKIVDFGVARIAERTQLTRVGAYLGTLAYMAPEQADARAVDGRADLYALGCLLHEMVAGRSPYQAETAAQWITAHMYGTPAPLRTHAPDAPAALEELVAELLAKDPAGRPASADVVGTRIAGIRGAGAPEPAAAGEPAVPTAPGPPDAPAPEPPVTEIDSGPGSERAARAGAPTVVRGGTAEGDPAGDATVVAGGTPDPRRRRRVMAALVAVVAVGALAGTGVAVWANRHAPAVAGPSQPPSATPTITASQPPAPHVPAGFDVGGCYDSPGDAGSAVWSEAGDWPSVPCTDYHWIQVVSAGQFAGAVAAGTAPPARSAPATRQVYSSCGTPANVLLGGDWRTSQTWLVVVLPAGDAWARGARWWACGLVFTGNVYDSAAEFNFDLTGGLVGRRPAALTCMSGHLDRVKHNTVYDAPVSCAQDHFAELIGVYRPPAQAFPRSDKDQSTVAFKGCDAMFAKFVGVAHWYDAYVEPSFGAYIGEAEWNLGDRAYQCFAFVPSGQMKGSVKGIGTRHPPP